MEIIIVFIKFSLKLDFDGKFGLSTSKYVILNHSGPMFENVETSRKI